MLRFSCEGKGQSGRISWEDDTRKRKLSRDEGSKRRMGVERGVEPLSS